MSLVIKLEKVDKSYTLGENKLEVLKNINLEIKKGEFVAIVGPSGSGKSTLMHIIGQLDTPTSGVVYLSGKNLHKADDSTLAVLRNKHIGFVFQAFNLLPKTSALDNVELPLIYSGIEKSTRDQLAKKALIQVGLGDKLRNFPSQLSGGQQQRVAIARALVNKPVLILADEPTGNLDSKSGNEIIKLFKSLNNEGNTVVIVTHDWDVAKVANRIVEIRDGEINKDYKTKK